MAISQAQLQKIRGTKQLILEAEKSKMPRITLNIYCNKNFELN